MAAVPRCPECGQPRANCQCLARQMFRDVAEESAAAPVVRGRGRRSSSAIVGHVVFYGLVPLATIGLIAWLISLAKRPAEGPPVVVNIAPPTGPVRPKVPRLPTRPEPPSDPLQAQLRHLAGPNADNRRKAADELANQSPLAPKAVPELLRLAQSDPVIEVRIAAIKALAHAGPEDRDGLYRPLFQVVGQTSPNLRQVAADALLQFGPPTESQVPTLQRELKNAASGVRALAARLLGTMGPAASGASGPLDEATQDADADVRSNAVTALALVAGDAAQTVKTLSATTSDSDVRVRRAALVGLRRLAPRRGVLTALIVAADKFPDEAELQSEVADALSAFSTVPQGEEAAVLVAQRSRNPRIHDWGEKHRSPSPVVDTSAPPKRSNDPIRNRLAWYRTQFKQADDRARKTLLVEINRQLDVATRQGNLAAVKEIREALAAFEKNGKLPNKLMLANAQAKYLKEIVKPWNAVVVAYAKAIQAYTKAMKLKDAEEVQKELEAFLLMNDQRCYWGHRRGFFRQEQDGNWVEKNGSAIYHFREDKRAPGYVELFDASRVCRVRLHLGICEVKFGDGPFRTIYSGGWLEPPSPDR